jgi:pyridoxamine 5'-phosphate oxidase
MSEFPPETPTPARETPSAAPPASSPDGAPLEGTTPPVPLTPEALGPDPIRAFRQWLADASGAANAPSDTAPGGDPPPDAGMRYPNALTLATVDAQGRPDARIVLLKGVDARGFQFFTNYRSAKARQLEGAGHAALVFYWDATGRQVRVRGPVERLPDEESDAYFQVRPRGSRIGAWTSEQSTPIESREALEARHHETEARFQEGEVPRPEHWGGYLLRPLEVEFWREGAWRLHDRILYRREPEPEPAPGSGSGGGFTPWTVLRLQP